MVSSRALLTNLIVNFVSAPRGTSKPYEALSVIANVLKLTESDRVKVGLLRQAGVIVSPRASVTPPGEVHYTLYQGFTDMWVAFLEKETAQADSGRQSPEKKEATDPSVPAVPSKEANTNQEPLKSSSYFSRLLG
jgi:GRAB domain